MVGCINTPFLKILQARFGAAKADQVRGVINWNRLYFCSLTQVPRYAILQGSDFRSSSAPTILQTILLRCLSSSSPEFGPIGLHVVLP